MLSALQRILLVWGYHAYAKLLISFFPEFVFDINSLCVISNFLQNFTDENFIRDLVLSEEKQLLIDKMNQSEANVNQTINTSQDTVQNEVISDKNDSNRQTTIDSNASTGHLTHSNSENETENTNVNVKKTKNKHQSKANVASSNSSASESEEDNATVIDTNMDNEKDKSSYKIKNVKNKSNLKKENIRSKETGKILKSRNEGSNESAESSEYSEESSSSKMEQEIADEIIYGSERLTERNTNDKTSKSKSKIIKKNQTNVSKTMAERKVTKKTNFKTKIIKSGDSTSRNDSKVDLESKAKHNKETKYKLNKSKIKKESREKQELNKRSMKKTTSKSSSTPNLSQKTSDADSKDSPSSTENEERFSDIRKSKSERNIRNKTATIRKNRLHDERTHELNISSREANIGLVQDGRISNANVSKMPSKISTYKVHDTL